MLGQKFYLPNIAFSLAQERFVYMYRCLIRRRKAPFQMLFATFYCMERRFCQPDMGSSGKLYQVAACGREAPLYMCVNPYGSLEEVLC